MSSSGSDSKKKQTVSQVSAPWGPQQPFLEAGFNAAKTDVLNKPGSYFPGSTVVPFSNQTNAALQGIEDRARAGNPLVGIGQNAIASTASGSMLNANPYLNEAINIANRPVQDQFLQNVLPGISSQFSAAGRYGSGAQQAVTKQATDQLLRQMSDNATGMSYQNFNNERARQLQAAALAPSLAEADYADLQKLGGVGAAREGQAAQELNDQIARHNYAQEEPYDRIARYMGLIGGQYGGNQVTTGPAQGGSGGSSVFGNALGGALGIGSLLGMTGAFPGAGTNGGWLFNMFK